MTVDYFKYSDSGERSVNEDSTGILEKDGLYAFSLCDGLGGHGMGDIASQTAVEAILKEAYNGNADCGTLESCFISADAAIREKQTRLNSGEKMKTTSAILLVKDNTAVWGHIGDSRIYYFHRNKIVKRSVDHSVPQMLCLAGEIKEKEIRFHPDRNRLLRCIPWDNKRFDIDGQGQTVSGGDCFMLMSDGFWEWIDEKEMKRCLKKGKSAREVVRLMTDYVFEHGKGKNMDNLSVIAVLIK